MFTGTDKSSYCLIRPFNRTTIQKQGKNQFIDRSMSSSATVDDNMPPAAGCYWTFYWLTCYVTNAPSDKQVSKRVPVLSVLHSRARTNATQLTGLLALTSLLTWIGLTGFVASSSQSCLNGSGASDNLFYHFNL